MSGIIFKNAGDDVTGAGAGMLAIGTVITALNVGLLKSKGDLMRKTQKGEDITPTDKLKQIRSTNIVTNLTVISSTLARYYLGNAKRIKPAAVLAGIPLGTVEELSMALSDRILKFRSTGGIYLAHQDGGNESLRIVCKAWGVGRYMFLVMLDFLFMYGSAKTLDLFKGSPWKDDITFDDKDSLVDKKDFDVKLKNPWKKFDTFNKDEGREEYHSTFPIVTKNRIFSSMYLETYDIVESVNTGMNMLTVTLFLRKYRPPYPLEFVRLREEKKGKGKRKRSRTAWYRNEEIENESIYSKMKIRWADSIMDFGLSFLIAAQKWFMMLEVGFYTPEEMFALTFATRLDKSRGLNLGAIFGTYTDKKGNIKVNKVIEKTMGLML